MNPGRRTLVALAAVLALLHFGPVAAQAPYPSKPVKIIVAFPPGQATDITARYVGEELSKLWGQPVVIENRPGGAGIPGMLAARDSLADGYTLSVVSSGTMATNVSLFPNLPYNPLKDFALIGGLVTAPLVLVAQPKSPVGTLGALIQEARAKPGQLTWAYPGVGAAQHITGEMLKHRSGIQVTDVMYKGSGAASQDFLGGQIPYLWDTVAALTPQILAGKMKPIVVTTLERIPQLPNVPTIVEAGFPDFENGGWVGMIAPAATPPAIVQKLAADTRKVLRDPVVIERLHKLGLIPDLRGPNEWADYVRNEISKNKEIVERAGIKTN